MNGCAYCTDELVKVQFRIRFTNSNPIQFFSNNLSLLKIKVFSMILKYVMRIIIKYVPKFFGFHLKDKYFVLQIIESVRKTNNLKNA